MSRPLVALWIKHRLCWCLFFRVGLGAMCNDRWYGLSVRPLRWPTVWLWRWADERVDEWHRRRA